MKRRILKKVKQSGCQNCFFDHILIKCGKYGLSCFATNTIFKDIGVKDIQISDGIVFEANLNHKFMYTKLGRIVK